MPTYERSTVVAAPLETVWDFHSTVDGLVALTPDWLDVRVDSVRGPDDGPAPDVLDIGSTIQLSVAPFGLGPRQHVTSRIVAREAGDGAAYFRDEMVDGPFAEWVHSHLFYRDGDATHCRDVVRYELPGGDLGGRLAPLASLGFCPAFAYRHRRTKAILEA